MKNNTWVVLQREYTTRVKKKGFFIMTILGPILLVALMFAPALLMQMGDESKTYALVDETGLYSEAFAGADDVVMSIQLADDEYEGKMVLGDYEPELPVYPVARRDGVLLVTADKEMRTTAYTDQEEVGAALALAAKTEIEQSPVHDDMFMRPAKAPVVRQTDVAKTVSPKKEVVAEQINRYHNSR